MKKIIFALILLLTAVTFTACQEDYDSYPPKFEGLFAVSMDGTETLRAGEEFTVTAKESKAGRYLYRVTYQWGVEPGNLTQNTYTSRYDDYKVGRNPSAKMILSSKGTYKVKLVAKYWISAQPIEVAGTETTENGTTVKYENGAAVAPYTVTITKNIKVEAPRVTE